MHCLITLGLFLLPVPQDAGPRFLDFSVALSRRDVVVAIGTVGKVQEGKRERMKDGEAQLGEGGMVVNEAGTVFYKVQAGAKVTITKPLHGTKETSLQVGFPMQWAKLNDGSIKRHLLLTPRVEVREDSPLLLVLEKEKGNYKVLAAMRSTQKEESPQAFAQRAEDVFAINVFQKTLREAIATAQELEGSDAKKALATLREGLARKPKLLAESSEMQLSMHAGPIEKRANALLRELEARSPTGDK